MVTRRAILTASCAIRFPVHCSENDALCLNWVNFDLHQVLGAQARWVASEQLVSLTRCAMKNEIVTVLAGAFTAVLATIASAAEPTQVERVQAAIDAWLAARAPIEKVTGIAGYISFGAAGPAIEAFSGKVGRNPDAGRVDQDTLYHAPDLIVVGRENQGKPRAARFPVGQAVTS
jgi:hypothetical protein